MEDAGALSSSEHADSPGKKNLAAAASISSPSSTLDSVAHQASPAQVRALQAEVQRLRSQLEDSEAKVGHWEKCMQQLVHRALLSPDMNEMYKTECSRVLSSGLSSIEQITHVHYVDCSFPSVPSEVRVPRSSPIGIRLPATLASCFSQRIKYMRGVSNA